MIVGTGVDLVEIGRIKKAIDARGERFLNRVFTSNEIEYCGKKKSPYQCYACRFAAKEAVFKALGIGWRLGMKWTEMEVLNDPRGQPYIFLSGKVKTWAEEMGIRRFLISLSHTRDYALCQLLALKE